MQIKTYSPMHNAGFPKKQDHKISFGAQSQNELRKTLRYIDNIEKVPEDPSDDIKFIANANDIVISPRNITVFSKTIQGILGDPELKIKKEQQLDSYKTYLTYLNENTALINNPQKVFPKPEMFSHNVALYITDYLERESEPKEAINKPSEIEYEEEKIYKPKPKAKAREIDENDDFTVDRERSRHVKSGNWKNKLLSNGGWAATAILGTFMAAQNLNLPQIKVQIVPPTPGDQSAEVEQNPDVSMPTKIDVNSNKIIKSVNSGTLTLFTLGKSDAQQGDRILLNGKSFPLYFDQQNKTWGTLLVFSKEIPIENGKATYPLLLERDGKSQKQLGLLEIKGRVPNEGESSEIIDQSTETNPAYKSSSSLLMTQKPFIIPASGDIGFKYGDVTPEGEFIKHNEIKSTQGSKVVSPIRGEIVKIGEKGIVIDGGWGLQFTISEIKPNSEIQVGKIVEQGTQIAEASGERGQVNFVVAVNGVPTNFFGK